MQNTTPSSTEDQHAIEIDQADLLILESFHPSPYVRQAATDLNWNLTMYNRHKANKAANAKN